MFRHGDSKCLDYPGCFFPTQLQINRKIAAQKILFLVPSALRNNPWDNEVKRLCTYSATQLPNGRLFFSPKIPAYVKYDNQSNDDPNTDIAHLRDNKTSYKEKQKSKNDISCKVFALHFISDNDLALWELPWLGVNVGYFGVDPQNVPYNLIVTAIPKDLTI